MHGSLWGNLVAGKVALYCKVLLEPRNEKPLLQSSGFFLANDREISVDVQSVGLNILRIDVRGLQRSLYPRTAVTISC